jgi:methionine synthase II (cobalamin-independent)
MDGESFRRYHCYSVKVNEILKKNEAMIRKVYDSFTHAKKRYIQNDEC